MVLSLFILLYLDILIINVNNMCDKTKDLVLQVCKSEKVSHTASFDWVKALKAGANRMDFGGGESHICFNKRVVHLAQKNMRSVAE